MTLWVYHHHFCQPVQSTSALFTQHYNGDSFLRVASAALCLQNQKPVHKAALCNGLDSTV
jgi:hypothetical protein